MMNMKEKGIYEILSQSPVFKGMKSMHTEEILKCVQHCVIKYKKGDMMALRGDEYEKLLVLIEMSCLAIVPYFSS
jgi:hypothetical protein